MSNVPEMLKVGADFSLSAVDPASTPGFPTAKAARQNPKVWARAELIDLGAQLAAQQEMLFANATSDPKDKRRLLLVLQAMDCGGKDGTVKKVAGTMNPQGLHIVGFGPPTITELRHDFLWRIRRALPKPGFVGVFNRSHYEDVLVARVRKLVPKRVWLSRYPQINDFERELADVGVTLVKVMLHISFEEQQRRLLARLHDPAKFWKYDPADVDNRAYWPAYQEAYNDALVRCSTDLAPWYVVPADRKWYRDWAVAHLVLHAFRGMDLQYPPANFDPQRERQRLEEGVSHT